MATWPASLGNPQFSGYDLETTDPTVRTDMEGGSARVRRRSTTRPDNVQLRFVFNETQMALFRAFWETELYYGSAWCNMPIKDGRSSGVQIRECRPTAGKFQASPLSSTHWAVSFQVEIRSGIYYFWETLNALGLPSLELDFAGSKSMSPVVSSVAQPTPSITFTRASTATYIDESGVIATAAVNTPRFDHDPITLACKGLLIEGTGTNLLLNSETLTTQTITVTAATRTLSFYGSGTVVLSGAHSATVVGLGAFPTRTSYTYTPSVGSLTLTVSGSVTFANDELGSFPTSYIPTTSAQATRKADVAQMTGVNFSSWYRQDEGTFVSKATRSNQISYEHHFSADDGSGSNYVRAYYSPDGTSRFVVLNGGTSQANINLGALSIGWHSIVCAYKKDDFSVSIDGGYTLSDTAGETPMLTRLNIGSFYDTSYFLNGHLARLSYYPKRLSNSELQRLSA